ncbi:HORMA domain-containing protein 1 isoform X1 [Gambusia affinis]|uniref:HORMA domain-containing protein 1 isoform X1 n=2 Tax=Gambusia affinis TaxID=33528 RepID=UPI000F2EB521|nr:HORMA domain-containing protein 1 isoform X1 [Gambusia affinis]
MTSEANTSKFFVFYNFHQMAYAQQVRPSQAAQILPEEVASEQQSLIVVKKLLAIAVSGITYLRGIFPGIAYGSKYVEGQKVMILKGNLDCPGTSQILHWMQGCFDAIQKKYLRAVIMSIYTDPSNPQKVTEYYQFKIQYTTEGTQVDFESINNNQKLSTMSLGNTRKASILLVRKLYTLMQNLGPLPENVCLNMKLAYYDEVTPQDYQPPGFSEAVGNTIEFVQEPVKLTMGKVATPYHCVTFDMATERRRLEQVEESVSVKEKWIVKIEEQVDEPLSPELEQVEAAENYATDDDNTEIQMDIHEKNERSAEVPEIIIPEASDMELGVKRTRSGRIIKSFTETNVTVKNTQPTAAKEKTVSQYDILSSQESSSASAAVKKRKFSEPKDHY